MAVVWQTLAELAKASAALPKDQFLAQFPAPFLLELSSEQGESLATNETRAYQPERLLEEAAPPSLTSSQIVYFGTGESFQTGRSSDCSIVCSHTTVSDHHCTFESFGSIWAIQDADSRNGTYLNGKRLASGQQSPLKFGTKIMLGEAQYQFLSSEDAFALIQELSREPRIRPRSLKKYRQEFSQAATPEQVRQRFPGPFLVVQAPSGRSAAAPSVQSGNTIALSEEELKKNLNKNVTDAVFDLSNHNLVRIGRATVTQIHLPLGAISNLHAALIREDAKWAIQDLGAKNGTHLWGERLEGSKEIESGTEIMLGNIKAIFFHTDDLLTYALHRDTLV